jgi:D-galactarolactone cycloisomerase
MRITRIEPIHVSIPFEHGAPKPSEGLGAGGRFDALFVRVDTDEGVTGWGEAFGYAAGPVTMAALTRIVAPFAVGRDATDITGLMGELWFRTKGMSRNGPVAFALSGLDIALWDIKGKVAGAPIWRLLGGAGRPRVEAYASLMRLGPAHVGKVAADAAAHARHQLLLANGRIRARRRTGDAALSPGLARGAALSAG